MTSIPHTHQHTNHTDKKINIETLNDIIDQMNLTSTEYSIQQL
jgi:hypothetical protein